MKSKNLFMASASRKKVGVVIVGSLLTIAIGVGFASNAVSANAQESLAVSAREINRADNNTLEAHANSNYAPILTLEERRSSVVLFAEYEEWGLTIEGLYPNLDGSFSANPIQNVFYQGQLIRGFSDFGHGVDMSISSFNQGDSIWIHVIRDESGTITEFNLVQIQDY